MARAKVAGSVVRGEEPVIADIKRPYSSADVCRAAGLSRATFDAWMLRKYLPLPPGPGTGRERRFSAGEAIMVAIAAHLTKGQVSISGAARAVEFLNEDHGEFWLRLQHEAGWVLVAGRVLSLVKFDDGIMVGFGRKCTSIKVEQFGDTRISAFTDKVEPIVGLKVDALVTVIANISEIARETLKCLTAAVAVPTPAVRRQRSRQEP